MPNLTEQETELGVEITSLETKSLPAGRRRFMLGMLMMLIASLSLFAGLKLNSSSVLKIDEKILIEKSRTVVAEPRNITSVLVMDASVVANPIFRLAAPKAGKLLRMKDGSVKILGTGETSATAQPVVLPASSKIFGLLVAPDTTVTAGLPILDAKYSGFALQTVIPSEKIYRLYNGIISAKGEITNGPGPFDSQILGIPFVPGNADYVEPMRFESTQTGGQIGGTTARQSPITNRQIGAETTDGQIDGTVDSGSQNQIDGQAESTATLSQAIAKGTGNEVAFKGANAAVMTRTIIKSSLIRPKVENLFVAEKAPIDKPFFINATSVPNASQGVTIIAKIPSNLNLIEGMPGLLALKVAEVKDAIALPVEAVAGISQQGQIYIYKDGKRKLRNVSLGITDGSYIQITSGLRIGEKVMLPSPSISNLR